MTLFAQEVDVVGELCRELIAADFGPFFGTPCAVFLPLHAALDQEAHVLTVAREDNAVGIATGGVAEQVVPGGPHAQLRHGVVGQRDRVARRALPHPAAARRRPVQGGHRPADGEPDPAAADPQAAWCTSCWTTGCTRLPGSGPSHPGEAISARWRGCPATPMSRPSPTAEVRRAAARRDHHLHVPSADPVPADRVGCTGTRLPRFVTGEPSAPLLRLDRRLGPAAPRRLASRESVCATETRCTGRYRPWPGGT